MNRLTHLHRLEAIERKSLLRLITCGSVGDGKSTLIGRLLGESKMLDEHQLSALEADSRKLGMQDDEFDFALVLDGLMAEREQSMTIDVAYRVFSTGRRSFIVYDAPGNEQYPANMATEASMASVGVILVDARKGVLTQTRRQSYIASLVGIRRVVLAVNKLDLVGYSREVFESIQDAYRRFAQTIGLGDVTCIPISALKGDNVTQRSENTDWFEGPTLIEYLETVDAEDDSERRPLRMLVQSVRRGNLDLRFSGRIVGGSVRAGDRIRVLPSGKESVVSRVITPDGDLAIAIAGEPVTVTLADEIDISRGDMICSAESPAAIADQFETTLIWMSDEDMLPGRSYLMKIGARTVGVSVATPKYKVNVNTLEHLAARTLHRNDIGVCNVNLDEPVPFDAYAENRTTGSFILIDPSSHATIGAGMLHFALRRSQNIHWQAIEVNRQAHAALNGHRPCVVWFTGLSGAGKSTIANLVEKKLHAMGRHTYLLDGDNVRHGLNKDLGFTEADRVENIRRVAEVARLMVDAGLIVLVSFISPFAAERRMARSLVGENEFCEVFVDVPIEVAEQRDAKGLYKKARRGELKNFTGIDSPYEPPARPEIHIHAASSAPDDAAEQVVAKLAEMSIFNRAH
ncbi:MAG TPA: adenylyl-sulfate kinase [Burkholderiales bacterium]|nr:adenylyl-sulfate kinase [Burkholderiales bacterium]